MTHDDNGAAALAAADDFVLPEDGAAFEDAVLEAGVDEEREAEAADTPPSPRRSVQARIDEVTRARRDAERERDFWREEAMRFQPPEDQPPAFDPREADTAAHHAVEQDWQARQAAFAQGQPDYAQVVEADWACSPVMADAIRTSEAGAAVAYVLAQNPDAARHIAGLPPLVQVREIGRLEAHIALASQQPQPKTISDAPRPAPQIRGGAGRLRVDPATDSFSDFDRVYGN